ALEAAARGLREAVGRHGPDALGVLLAPDLTLEELHLGAGLARGLGSDNVDHRVRQADFRGKPSGAPWLGMPVAALDELASVLLVGSNIRKEQPLVAVRLRTAAKKGCAVSIVNVAADDPLMPLAARVAAKPSELAAVLAAVAGAAAQAKGERAKGDLKRAIGDTERAIAASLARPKSAILLGHYAQQHPDYAVLLAIARELGRLTGATVGVLPDGGNAVGAHLVGALPTRGLDAKAMIDSPRKAYLVAGVELGAEMGGKALRALAGAECGVVLTAYRDAAADSAHVMLPIATFAETAGTFVNMEGRVQSFNACVKPGRRAAGMEGAAHAGLAPRASRVQCRADRAGARGYLQRARRRGSGRVGRGAPLERGRGDRLAGALGGFRARADRRVPPLRDRPHRAPLAAAAEDRRRQGGAHRALPPADLRGHGPRRRGAGPRAAGRRRSAPLRGGRRARARG